jgi:hypothetical protein
MLCYACTLLVCKQLTVSFSSSIGRLADMVSSLYVHFVQLLLSMDNKPGRRFLLYSTDLVMNWKLRTVIINQRDCSIYYCATFPVVFFYGCADLLLLCSRTFLHDLPTARHFKFFCNFRNKKIPAVRQQFSVRGSISVTARPRTRAA